MTQTSVLFLAVIAGCVTISLQASSPHSDSYVAAVVEYAPVSGATLENKEQIFMQNVANYGCFMEEAAKQGADIIVFPEVGLASMGVPRNPDGTPSLAFIVPAPGANPCDDPSTEIAQGLKELSCTARKHGLYVVVNLPEKVVCDSCPCPGFPVSVDATECPTSGFFFHNTNVVFNRRGTIVARYRKFNLYGEPGFVPTPDPEYAIFETDFGVRFGTFICFDIMFEQPAAVLARNHSVCDFAFPTAWFSEAPFLTAVQSQAAWAHSLDVNLLAAGYNKPEVGSAGSGIYLGRKGTLQSVMPNTTTSRLLVGSVPKMQRCKDSVTSRHRIRREIGAPRGEDDDEEDMEQTPLSAFHRIVQQRKYGHLGEDDDIVDSSAPAFIHHKMYDEEGDEEAETDDESDAPVREHATAAHVPTYFLGLQEAAEAKEEDEVEAAESRNAAKRRERDNAIESDECPEEVNTDDLHPCHDEDQRVDIPDNKIIYGTTNIHQDHNPKPSQNPDLLRLYKKELEEMPQELLEIELPDNTETEFEAEHEQEYFKLGMEPVGTEKDNRKHAHLEKTDEREPLKTENLDVPHYHSESEGDEGAKKKEKDEDDSFAATRTTGEDLISAENKPVSERNATDEEIEATLRNLYWLVDDTDDLLLPDNGEQVQESRDEQLVDDTDDFLEDDQHDDSEKGGSESNASPEQETKLSEDSQAEKKQQSVNQETKEKGAQNDQHDDSENRDSESNASPEQETKLSEDSPAEKEQQSVNQETKEKGARNDQHDDSEKIDSESNASPQRETKLSEDSPAEQQQQSVHQETKEKGPRKCKKRGGNSKDPSKSDKRRGKCKPKNEDQKPTTSHEATDGSTSGISEDVNKQTRRPCKQRVRRGAECPAFRDGIMGSATDSSNSTGIYLKRDNLDVYKTFTLNTDSLFENSTVRLCDGTFCCDFSVVLEVRETTPCSCQPTHDQHLPRYAYRLAVFNGVRSFDGAATGGLQVCGVIPCSGDDLWSCGVLTLPDGAAAPTVFRRIAISGVFSTKHTLVTANTLAPGLLALPSHKFNFTSTRLSDGQARVSMETTDSSSDEGLTLLTFAIYSRDYTRDGQPETTVATADSASDAI